MKVISHEPARKYIGFEPQIECCFCVSDFIRRNDLGNAAVVPIALSDHNQIVDLYSNSGVDSMATIVDPLDYRGNKRQIVTPVQTRRGDDVLAELGVRDICGIKIDVERGEYQVLAGLAGTIREHSPPIIFEMLPNFYGPDRIMLPDDRCAQNQQAAKHIEGFFDNHDYEINQLYDDGSIRPIKQFDLNDRERFIGTNYIAKAK